MVEKKYQNITHSGWYPVFMVASVCTAIIGATVLVWLVRLEVRNVSWLL